MKININEEQIKRYIFEGGVMMPADGIFFESGIEWNDPKMKELEEQYGHNYWTGKATIGYAVTMLMLGAQDKDIDFSPAEKFVIDKARYWTQENNHLKREEYENKQMEQSKNRRRL